MENETALSIIINSEILKKEDFETVSELKEELNDTFQKVQSFRTRTEMEVSVLNSTHHVTPDAKYWQAIREQNVMFNELVRLSYDYRVNQIQIKKLEREEKITKDDLDKELVKIEIERKNFLAKCQEKEAHERIRELREWHEIKEELKPQLKYGTENCNAHQLESYTKRWINQAIASKGAGGFGERINIMGQLKSGLDKCKELGIKINDKLLAKEEKKLLK